MILLILISFHLGCNSTFIHLLDFNMHVRRIHGDRAKLKCSICQKTLRKAIDGDIDTKHLSEHGFSLCHCAYCLFGCNDIESMHSHLRDQHPTKLPYSFVRVSNGLPNSSQIASIAYFGDDDNRFDLVHPSMTDLQINFMNPALCEYASNSDDPPGDDDSGSTLALKKKKQFIDMQKLVEHETKQIRKEHNIETIQTLFLDSSHRIPTVEDINFVDAPDLNQIPATASTSAANEASTEYAAMVQNEIDSAANTLLKGTGVDSQNLYRCAFDKCTWLKTDEREFLMHLAQHKGGGVQFKCFHCNELHNSPITLKNHIKTHLKHRFFCFYCVTTASTQQEINHHFETNHNNRDSQYLPLNPMKYDLATDIFVVCPKDVQTLNDFITLLVKRVDERQAAKQSYMPEEIDLLPKRAIFSEELQCGRCNFSNKVRANLIRHFQLGCTERQAPVNPVPCLNSGDRHCDKMRNLAASSNPDVNTSALITLGKFVPDEKRYICGAKSCTYLALCADRLQQHIVTLHASENYFRCPHCSVDLSNCSNATEILNHFRYHDSKIFRCPQCHFIHYWKHQVEKHIIDAHPNSKDRALTVERKKAPEAAKPPAKSTTYKWICNICSKIFNTRPLAKSHVNEIHRLAYQFKCSICTVSSDTKTSIKDHLLSEHRENDPLKIKIHYDRVESEAVNSPIWQRDDPTRVSFQLFRFFRLF